MASFASTRRVGTPAGRTGSHLAHDARGLLVYLRPLAAISDNLEAPSGQQWDGVDSMRKVRRWQTIAWAAVLGIFLGAFFGTLAGGVTGACVGAFTQATARSETDYEHTAIFLGLGGAIVSAPLAAIGGAIGGAVGAYRQRLALGLLSGILAALATFLEFWAWLDFFWAQEELVWAVGALLGAGWASVRVTRLFEPGAASTRP
jgi:hypothetical protein